MALTMPLIHRRDTEENEEDNALFGLPPALRRLLVSALAILATAVLWRLLLGRFDAPVRELAVTGTQRHVKPQEVEAAAAPALEAQLFELDLDALRQAIEALPWVAHARVDRIWPARIAVRITEREAFARWGVTQALSTEGVVFSPGSEALPEGLPLLNGVAGREKEVMTAYGQLIDRLGETPFALKGLTQDARGDWTATTQSGVRLKLGRGDPLVLVDRLKSVVLPALAGRLEAVQHIDLRYDNGFAVGWKNGDTPHNVPPSPPQAPASASPAIPGVHP